MLQAYLPLLVLFLVVAGFAVVNIAISELLGRQRAARGKLTTYECGMTPVGTARGRFSVKFYLVAVFFILFDIEAVFLIPWAVNLKGMVAQNPANGLPLFTEMLVFLGILFVGLLYVWKKGGLEWDQ
jgi:NADH-quinone oxidoreductase subunit A